MAGLEGVSEVGIKAEFAMFNHRRKIAVAVALILALGSAAASAANFTNGKGAMPSFAGAGDALEMAMSGAGKASNWLLTHSRKSVNGMLALLPPSSIRPSEVPYVPESPPMVRRGPTEPVKIGPARPYGVAFSSGLPDRARPGSFEERLRSFPNSPGVSSVDPSLPGLPSGGVSSDSVPDVDVVEPLARLAAFREPAASEPIMAAVPEPESYVMLLAGLGLMGMIARRSGKLRAV